jgi:hypothetical protein
LRTAIEDRFIDAYAAQISYLQHATREEMVTVESDIGRLRNIAWAAQKSASEQARRADVARAALRDREESSWDLRQALVKAQQALQAERGALEASRASLLQTQWEHAQAKTRADQEISEMTARCQAASLQRQTELQCAANMEQELATARAGREAESEAAREQARRCEVAIAQTAQAKAGLQWRDSVAEQTLREAVQRLEADFARERADFLEQDRRSLSRAQAVERQAQKEQWGATVGRALARPQASTAPLLVQPVVRSKWKAAATAATAAHRMGMLAPGQVVVPAQS